ncbi:hypothetical protein PU02_0832 [Bartonella ancashensis]|uniref:Uncharacterized protein n=1 Tax=Bartonella ancashensis TaxID=1318743 RepID=A0A0M4L743_9HYPH|nr:hypothetical protein PU02_0832 [Bartonella ancashensis]
MLAYEFFVYFFKNFTDDIAAMYSINGIHKRFISRLFTSVGKVYS